LIYFGVGKTDEMREDRKSALEKFTTKIQTLKLLSSPNGKIEIPLAEAIRMSNLYPARAIGVDDRLGSVEKGKIANLAVFTSDYKVTATVLNGEWKPN